MTALVRFYLLIAGFLGLTGVAMGAFGAHALSAVLVERGMTHAWETASRYHLLHAIAVLTATVWLRTAQGSAARRISWVVKSWTLGIVLFSGSLYGLALGGPRWLGPVTPVGGVALMAGWIMIIATAFARED